MNRGTEDGQKLVCFAEKCVHSGARYDLRIYEDFEPENRLVGLLKDDAQLGSELRA